MTHCIELFFAKFPNFFSPFSLVFWDCEISIWPCTVGKLEHFGEFVDGMIGRISLEVVVDCKKEIELKTF